MNQYRKNMNSRLTTVTETSAGQGGSVLPPMAHAVSLDSSLDRTHRAGNGGMSQLLTVQQVATLLNVPRKWVYRRVGLKPPEGIPHVKVGKYVRFRETDLRDFVERLRRN
jgi:excisionase family DNA binding protein